MSENNTKASEQAAVPMVEQKASQGLNVKASIKGKIGLAFAVAGLGMAAVAATGFYLTNQMGFSMDNMSRNATSLLKEGRVATLQDSTRGNVLDMVVLALSDGDKSDKLDKLSLIHKNFEQDKAALLINLDENSKLGAYDDKIAGFSADMKPDFDKLNESGAKIASMVKAYVELGPEVSDTERKTKIRTIQEEYSNSFFKTFMELRAKNDRATKAFDQKNKDIKELAVSQKKKSLENHGIALILALLVGSLMVGFLFKSLNKKITELLSMIQSIKENQLDVNYNAPGDDELKLIGQALSSMASDVKNLQDKNATMLSISKIENIELNDSIVELLQTVFSMTEKDLTVKAEVKDNVVGTIADSINMVIRSTNEAMVKASNIAQMVQGASVESQEKSTEIFDLSHRSKEAVNSVMEKVEKSLTEIRTISKVAQESKAAADKATESTSQALSIVKQTVSSMGSIRETISNTETKIKKLAERSQEIGFIVKLIGDISERTHVLALNATIQAAVAGDAGRGFAAIAEEIQKLAENTKEATNKIARLVENIQVETSETIQMVNQTIDKVVSGVKLAESSGQQMTETQGKTLELADAVRKISVSIAEHEALTGEMKSGAESLGGAQIEFSAAAQDQLMRARSLLSFSHKLQETVNEFKTS